MSIKMMTRSLSPLRALALAAGVIAGFPASSEAYILAGVDFEGANSSTFGRTPDNYAGGLGLTTSSGTNSGIGLFDGWTLLQLSGTAGASGDLRNDGGAFAAGATTPNFPARLEGNRTGSWSITIPEGVFLDLERVVFDVRGATGGTGRQGQFRTSLDAPGTYLWQNLNLPGRTSGNWQRITVDLSGSLYQGLTNQTVEFIWRTPINGAIDLDTIQVFGTVPEPAAPVLLGLGVLGMLGVRRRRRA